MNTAKGSAKELFRQMKEELNYRTNKKKHYEIFSNVSSEGDEPRSYYNEIKYLKKDQLKAYICKLRKEIKNYKIKELNFMIEIKYLKRKIIRLKNVIENDKILKHQRNFSLRSYGSELNSFKNGFCNHNINNSERNCKQNYFINQNNSLKSFHSNPKFRNLSIRSINDSIHNSKRKSVNNYDLPINKYEESSINKITFIKNSLKSDSSNSYYKNKEKHNNILCLDYRNKIESQNDFKRKNYFSNRSVSTISKFGMKKHLISNDKNIRNLSSEINNIISKDIKNYYNSKKSILSNKNINLSGNKLFQKLSHNNNYTDKINHKNNSKVTSNKLNIKELKKNYNCDVYNYNHHQNILNKKYSSPYAYNKNRVNNNEKKSEENIIKRNIKNIENKIIQLAHSENNPKSDNLKNKKISKIKENVSSTNSIYEENNKKNVERSDSTHFIQKMRTYLDKKKKKKFINIQ